MNERGWFVGKSLGFYSIILLLSAPILGAELYAADLWKALYSGRYLAMFQQFPHHSTFTFSPVRTGLTRNSFNWLGNLFFFGWYRLFGITGFQALRIASAFTAVVIIHSFARFRRSTLILLMLIMFIYGLHQKLTVRTALFSVPLTSLLMFIWYKVRQQSTWMWAFPVLFLAWSNIHGSYVIGLGFLGLLFFGEFLERFRKDPVVHLPGTFRPLILIGLVISATVFVKPFPDPTAPRMFSNIGNQLVVSLKSTEKIHSNKIFLRDVSDFSPSELLVPDRTWRSVEFESPFANTQVLFVWIGFLTAVFSPLILALGPHRSAIPEWFVLFGAIGLGLLYLRSVAYIPLIAFPLIFHQLDQPFLAKVNSESDLIIGTVLISSLIGLIGTYVLTGSVNRLVGFRKQHLGTGTIRKFSGKLPGYLLKNYPDKRFFNTYALGGFLIWKWWPYKKVFVDSKSSAYKKNFRRNRTTLSMRDLLSQYELRFALLHRTSPWNARYFLSNNDWKSIGMDSGTIAYRYEELPRD